MDNHRSRSVGNHAAFTRGVLTSFTNQLLQPCARKYSAEAWNTQQTGSHPRNKSSFLVVMLDREPGGFVLRILFGVFTPSSYVWRYAVSGIIMLRIRSDSGGNDNEIDHSVSHSSGSSYVRGRHPVSRAGRQAGRPGQGGNVQW